MGYFSEALALYLGREGTYADCFDRLDRGFAWWNYSDDRVRLVGKGSVAELPREVIELTMVPDYQVPPGWPDQHGAGSLTSDWIAHLDHDEARDLLRSGHNVQSVLIVGQFDRVEQFAAQIAAARRGSVRAITLDQIAAVGDLAAILTGLGPADLLFIADVDSAAGAGRFANVLPALLSREMDVSAGAGPTAKTVTLELDDQFAVIANSRSGAVPEGRPSTSVTR